MVPTTATIACVDRHVTVNYASGVFIVNPNDVEVCQGKMVFIKLVPPPDNGKAKTTHPNEGWLNKSNSGDTITIDTAPAEKGDYKYSITIEGVGTLDPGVRVV